MDAPRLHGPAKTVGLTYASILWRLCTRSHIILKEKAYEVYSRSIEEESKSKLTIKLVKSTILKDIKIVKGNLN